MSSEMINPQQELLMQARRRVLLEGIQVQILIEHVKSQCWWLGLIYDWPHPKKDGRRWV